MDAFENLPEAPDLSGQVTPLSYRPVFNGPYSCVYRGKIKSTGEVARMLQSQKPPFHELNFHQVAIKVLNSVEGTALHTMRRKLNRERRTWGVLNHPNILPLYGFADDEEMFQPFGALISPWLQRGDASRFLAEHGESLTVDERIDLWKDVISGVEYLHSHRPLLVHGDLKPRNILIDDSGHARICDFGLVRIFMGEGSSGMTTTTQHTGTERYLAYELVVAGDKAIPTTASDIYAMGCIGLEFIFSQVPYSTRRNNYGGMIYVDIRNGIPPAECPTDLTSGLRAFWWDLERCWERDPSRRPSAKDLILNLSVDLAFIQDEFPTPGLTEGGPYDPQSHLMDQAPTDSPQHFLDLTSSIPEEGSQDNFQVTSDLTRFTAHQKSAALKIYQYMAISPNKAIPPSLITSELWELDPYGDWGWCLIGRCGILRAYERDLPLSEEQRRSRKRMLDHLYDHIRDRHFVSRPFRCSVCPQAFSSEHDLSRHANIHSNTLPCEFCANLRGDYLRLHVDMEHWSIPRSTPVAQLGPTLSPDSYRGDEAGQCPLY